MDERMNDLDRLAVLDPARDREPGAMEWTRSQAFIERTMAGEAARTAWRPARRWLIAGAGAMAVGALAAVAVPALVPGAAEQAIASWTAMPTARTGDQVMPQARTCAAGEVGGTTTATAADVLLAEERGDATLLIMRKGDGIVECLLVGDDDQAASMGLTDTPAPPLPPSGTVNLETMSSYGDGDDQWSNIVGLAAPDVTAVEVRLDGGGTVQASVKAGWWAAWWPGAEGGEVDALTVTVHAGDRTTTHRPSELP
ncbi:hypothetical protein AB0G04_34120 [Actinoplanes sp. NPDC023801]|uniref:hypothetical protein n=1 Tax=Actinoplanes sp. NPDC023801 TaxID=3154595 RepID=UPI00340C7D7B